MNSSTLSLTSALDEGGRSTPRLGRFTPVNNLYPLFRGLGGLQGRSLGARKISPPPGFDPRTFQSVVSRFTDCAILGLNNDNNNNNNNNNNMLLPIVSSLPRGVYSLTLRRLMSYIYIYIYMEHPFLMFLDHTQRRSTVGRTPLDE